MTVEPPIDPPVEPPIEPPVEPEPDPPPAISMVMSELLHCLCTELLGTVGGEVCWCGLWHGDPVPWDYCDACSGGRCGMAYVRLVGAFPYDSFPTPAVDQFCTKYVGYAIEVGVMRCFPIMEEDGSLTDAATVTDAVLITYDDMLAMRRALLCCTNGEVWLDAYLPANEGGCAGGAWTAFVSTEP